MTKGSADLKKFGDKLQSLIDASKKNGYWENCWRPFVCDGSPLDCKVFLVGYNPANAMPSFRNYWQPSEGGFDKGTFLNDYRKKRQIRGARLYIENLVEQLENVRLLETNIYPKPGPKPRKLKCHDFTFLRFLLEEIKPPVVITHGPKASELFRAMTDVPRYSKINEFVEAAQLHSRSERFSLLETEHFAARGKRGQSDEKIDKLAEKIQDKLKKYT